MLYAFEAVAAIAFLVINIFKRERKHSSSHYRKFKPIPNNGQVAAIDSLVLNIFKRERKHSRNHYRKSKPMSNNGQNAVHPSLHKAYWHQRFVM